MLYKIIQQYWDKRYQGYSQKNKKEIESVQIEKWKYELIRWLPKERTISILDIGTGPGFFPIVLKQMGYTKVTAIDASANMLQIAQENPQIWRRNARYRALPADECPGVGL